ncbi:response regulator receiver and ANTAR domain protein [Duganella sacchari]|uniref:Response regulator receiver and ANTAR domain protein n=1 Tax=Duganella sacchari TaxID=551987 RepID=A0A1M7KPS2_9BURK|nr:response regulator [Duganella sacchari]SHM67395.1 response regulator receiver and ANTAR domain protein [Duganella sacchari]
MSLHGDSAPLVLLVDDDLPILGLLARTLEAAGLRVRLASSGAQALASLSDAAPPELAVLDITMPDMSGLELAARMDGVPHMFLSANDEQDVVEQAARSGAVGFLRKPIDLAQLLPAVRAALARGAEIRGLRAEEQRLGQALREGRETGMAIGLLMERYRLDQLSALNLLRDQARSHQRRLNDVARELLAAADTLNALGGPLRK